MANNNAPFGFRPARHLTGGQLGRLSTYKIAAGYATDIMSGDVVRADGAGNIGKLTIAGDVPLGIFSSVKYVQPDGTIKFARNWSASTPTKAGTDIEALVYDDPMMSFHVQTSGTVLYANQLKFVDVVDGAGNALTGTSSQTVGNPGGVASQLAVLGVVDTIPQVINSTSLAGGIAGFSTPSDGQYALLEVRFVKHALLGSAAGVAA